jgi:hypothetical protein
LIRNGRRTEHERDLLIFGSDFGREKLTRPRERF